MFELTMYFDVEGCVDLSPGVPGLAHVPALVLAGVQVGDDEGGLGPVRLEVGAQEDVAVLLRESFSLTIVQLTD